MTKKLFAILLCLCGFSNTGCTLISSTIREIQLAQERKHFTKLLRLLSQPDLPRRRRIAVIAALGRCGFAQAGSHVAAFLQDSDPIVRVTAMRALRCLGYRDALGPIMACLHDRQALVRQEAVLTLGRLRVSSAVPLLVKLAYDQNEQVRMQVALALSVLGWEAQPSVVPVLVTLLHDPEATVRAAAVFALGEIRAVEQGDLVVKLLQDPDRLVRAQAVVALGRLGTSKAVPALLAFFRQSCQHVERIAFAKGDWLSLRMIAAWALAKIGDPHSIEAQLVRWFQQGLFDHDPLALIRQQPFFRKIKSFYRQKRIKFRDGFEIYQQVRQHIQALSHCNGLLLMVLAREKNIERDAYFNLARLIAIYQHHVFRQYTSNLHVMLKYSLALSVDRLMHIYDVPFTPRNIAKAIGLIKQTRERYQHVPLLPANAVVVNLIDRANFFYEKETLEKLEKEQHFSRIISCIRRTDIDAMLDRIKDDRPLIILTRMHGEKDLFCLDPDTRLSADKFMRQIYRHRTSLKNIHIISDKCYMHNTVIRMGQTAVENQITEMPLFITDSDINMKTASFYGQSNILASLQRLARQKPGRLTIGSFMQELVLSTCYENNPTFFLPIAAEKIMKTFGLKKLTHPKPDLLPPGVPLIQVGQQEVSGQA